MIPPIANRFIAGETEAAAIDRASTLTDRGLGTILNLLGEHYEEPAVARADADRYVDLIEAIADNGLQACVSVKPSQIGLSISESLFYDHLERIVRRAATEDGFVWLDMEDHTTTGVTLEAFERFATEQPGTVGVCVQANLKRTRTDLERLAGSPGKIRLVKGAYDPPADIAYTEKARVNEAYANLLDLLFREHDAGVAVATHDDDLIERALTLHGEFGTAYEVQMLMGVREEFQHDLARSHPVWQYVPYGEKWISYFTRRIAERKENLLFALRAILGW